MAGLRIDPLSGRRVVIAPRRLERPGARAAPRRSEPSSDAELDQCPFCVGREDRTPPETLRLPENQRWRVRVVPNLYPAFEHQEVVLHAPEHVRSLAELDDAQVDLVADAWRRRRQAEPHGYLFAGLNEGREAGASLHHSHSQLVWLPGPPPAVAAERAHDRLLEGTLVADRDGVRAVSPHAARVPYETRIAPAEQEDDAFASERLAPALRLLAETVRRLHRLEGSVPLNAWLHGGRRWHLHLVPRLTVAASVELGTGIDINPLPPEEAAQRLRSA